MIKKYIIYIISFAFTFSCYASIKINKDRFFYKEQDKEILFDIKNNSEKESYIIQSGYHTITKKIIVRHHLSFLLV